MATLALTAIGSALGGPVGAAIGGFIGQGIDRQLFGPGPKRGPRLNDLTLQTSSYGTPIPRVYGTMRVAGSVVWATELKESREVQADAVVYSYSASFAVALSSRPAARVGRIWADGKLLRGAAGDFKVKTKFRFYPGGQDQLPDSLIASVQGIDQTPAYRGIALAVFEELQLADFGNRIPFITFELIAEEAEPTVASILRDSTGGAIDCGSQQTVGGYAAYGSSRRAAVEPLIDQFAVELVDSGARLTGPTPVSPVGPSVDELGCGSGADKHSPSERTQAAVRTLPGSIELAYYEPARDYQAGQMRAAAAGGGRDEAVELPAALSADRAKAIAETSIARRWARRDRLALRLPPDRLSVGPGTIVELDEVQWRVEQATLEEFVVRLDLSRAWAPVAATPADAGSHLPAPDQVAAPTTLALLDLPDLGLGRPGAPAIHAAACQPVAGWRQILLEVTAGGRRGRFPRLGRKRSSARR